MCRAKKKSKATEQRSLAVLTHLVAKHCTRGDIFSQFLQRINIKSTFNNATLFCTFFLTYFIEIIIKKMLITWKFKLQHVNFMHFIRLYCLLLGTVSRRIKCLLFHFHWNILIQNVDICFPNINTSLNPAAVSTCVPAIFLGHPFPVLLGRTKGILCKFWRHNQRLLRGNIYVLQT